jgi:endonuclease IV
MSAENKQEKSSNKLIIGLHVNKEWEVASFPLHSHIETAINNANENGIDIGIIQVFLSNPKSGKLLFDPDDKKSADKFKDFKEYIIANKEKIKVVVHSSYVSNALWAGKKHYPGYILRSEMKLCEDAQMLGTIFHLDTHGIEDVISYLPSVMPKKIENTGSRIYLESSHTKPEKSLYETPEKISKLFSAIKEKIDPNLDKIGFCLDTAHIWTSGADIQDYDSANEWLLKFAKIRDVLPMENVLIHLNGSVYEKGDGRDKHATLMSSEDKIWSKYINDYKKSGLCAILNFAREWKIPCILERKKPIDYLGDYKVLYENELSTRFKNSK